MIEHAKAFNFRKQRLWLLPQKAVYWQKRKTLLIADLHIGKSGHFRRNGIPVPQQVNGGNLQILDALLKQLPVDHLIFLGDLFHSAVNEEWQQFRQWRAGYSQTEVSLVIGNHDVLARELYHASHISLFSRLKMGPFLLVHDVGTLSGSAREHYPLGGHIHPALKLRGKGRQSMKVPCYYFGTEGGILPAFGQFTGTAVIHPGPGDHTFLIADNRVLAAGGGE